jgi:hypothetical protein
MFPAIRYLVNHVKVGQYLASFMGGSLLVILTSWNAFGLMAQ